MNVTDVKSSQYYRGIPCKGKDALREALRTFAGEGTKGSQATRTQLVRDGGLGGIFTLVGKMQTERGKQSPFLQKLFDEIDTGLNSRDFYSNSYDYDGVGPFFKTSVEVQTFDKNQDINILGLWAAYVGDEVEKGLAETLGVERGLLNVCVEVQLEPDGDKFQVDINELLEKLKTAGLELSDPSVKNALKQFIPKDPYKTAGRITLIEANGLTITINLCDVEECYKFWQGKSTRTWTTNNSIVTGPLKPDYEDKTKFMLPKVLYAVNSSRKNSIDTSHLPFIDTESKAHAIEVGQRIETAFKQ